MSNGFGFRGLDEELRIFHREKEFLQLKKGCVTRQDKRLTEIERQLSTALSWKRKMESETPGSVSPQFQSLERNVAA